MTVALHHEITGPADAPTVVFVGSLGSTGRMWDPQWVALADRFRLVRIDARGHGGSPVGPRDQPTTIADLAADVSALLDELGLARVAYCGLSLGAMIGMRLAADEPERIERLALCCTSAYFADPTPWRDRAAAVRSGGTASIADAVVDRWFTASWAAANPAAVSAARAMVVATPDAGYAAACDAIASWDGRDALARIVAPTLVIAGDADPATPVVPHAITIVEGITGARLEVLPGAHLATIEQADRASALLAEHLSA